MHELPINNRSRQHRTEGKATRPQEAADEGPENEGPTQNHEEPRTGQTAEGTAQRKHSFNGAPRIRIAAATGYETV